MDNFIDRLSQKFTASDVIRANQEAEKQELKRLQIQVDGYENCLQEMRKLQFRNMETAEGLKQLVEENRQAFEVLTRESLEKVSQVSDHHERKNGWFEQEIEKLLNVMEENQKTIGEWFQQADEFLHRENVKVYRNVQAVVVEESKAKTAAILAGHEEVVKKYYRRMAWMTAITLFAAAAGVVIQVIDLYCSFS